MRIKDLPMGHRPLEVVWRKRRYRCAEPRRRLGGCAVVEAWLAAQPPEWRAGVEVVELDPSAPFAAAIRWLAPQATIVVDHWHLVRLANQAVTEVRSAPKESLGPSTRRCHRATQPR